MRYFADIRRHVACAFATVQRSGREGASDVGGGIGERAKLVRGLGIAL